MKNIRIPNQFCEKLNKEIHNLVNLGEGGFSLGHEQYIATICGDDAFLNFRNKILKIAE